MARIAIVAYGSRGDVAPMTDFGSRLQSCGHDVVMTSTPDLVEEIEECGLTARPVDIQIGDPNEPGPDNPMKSAMQFVLPTGMRQLGQNLLDALEDVPADVLLLSPFAELVGHPLAEARGIPAIGVRMQPLSATGAFPPSLIGDWSAGAALNRGAGRFTAAMIDRIYGKTVAGFREQLGLPRASARALRRARTAAEWPILHGFSPSVVPRPDDWRPGLDVTGYWWPQHQAGWQPPPELSTFLSRGPAPVFLGLGSLMVSATEATHISDIVRGALEKVGMRGVIQAGGAELNVSTDDIMTIGTVPHQWLFSHVAAVAHSCGAGTTAAGLRAGLPTVALPSPGGDQPFWAKRLHALGVSPKPIPRPKLTVDRLALAIDAALTEPGHRAQAQQLADQIAGEDGAAHVVTAIERLVST